MIEVIARGGLTTIQDRGRPGFAHQGVPPSGALDQAALDLGNRLVGNPPDAAGIEMTVHGPTLRFHRAATVVLVGAEARARLDATAVSTGAPFHVPAGAVLKVGPLSRGCRTYLAVRGGIAVPPVLGSRATDSLTGLGPPVLAEGSCVPLGEPTEAWPGIDFAPPTAHDPNPTLTVHLGPRLDYFSYDAARQLFSGTFTVSPDSNRVALRLTGLRLVRVNDAELPSEGLVTGAIQVPPTEQPILFLNDHPTTGGYPVIGVVATAELSKAAQLRPGDTVRFQPAAA